MSSNIIAVIEQDLNIVLLMPTKEKVIITNSSTPETAASLLRQVAPPAKVKIVLLLFVAQKLEFRITCVQALQKEGYTNIESIDGRVILLSSAISDLSLKCEIGEPVFVNCVKEDDGDSFDSFPMCVIQKCKKGWQIIDEFPTPKKAVSNYPSTRNIAIYKDSPKPFITEVKKLFPNLKLHFYKDICPNDFTTYMRSRGNKTFLCGNEVLPYCSVQLTVVFSNVKEVIFLNSRVPPFSIEMNFDIDDAPHVTVYGSLIEQNHSLLEMEKLSFKDKAFRNVLLTVNVDKTLLPVVTMKMVSTYKPCNYKTSVIYSVWVQNSEYVLFAIYEDRVSKNGVYKNATDISTYIKKSSSATATKAIYLLYETTLTLRQLQEWRDNFAGYQPVQLLFNDSVTVSIAIDRAGISVLPGQTVAVVSPNVVYIIQRDGDLLQVLNCFRCSLQNFDVDKYRVDTVIIDNERNIYTVTDVEHLRLKYYPRAVIDIPGIVFLKEFQKNLLKYFWSRVNGTDYGGNFFNNFGHFEFHIEGDGVAETVDTRFKAIPYTVTADVKVADAKTLDVILFRDAGYTESLKEFDVPNDAKAVRFTICVESACDITVAMDIIDESEVTQQPEKPKTLEACGRNNLTTCTVDLLIQFGNKCQMVSLTEQIPFTINEEVDVGDASEVTVRALSRGNFDATPIFKMLKFKKSAFRKVAITVNIDQDHGTELTLRTASTYKPTVQSTASLDASFKKEPTVSAKLPVDETVVAIGTKNRSQRRRQARRNAAKSAVAEKPYKPTATPETHDDEISANREITTLTFTSDNRVQINAGRTYTGDKEILAYVRLQSGKAPEVGQKAFDAMKEHPGSVFYGITRLFAIDFDPDHPDPSWRFKTTRDSDGNVLVHGDDGVVTLPIVLFGFVVKCIQNYIKEHLKSDVPILGIRLPAGCVIGDADLKTISPLIGVELILLS